MHIILQAGSLNKIRDIDERLMSYNIILRWRK